MSNRIRFLTYNIHKGFRPFNIKYALAEIKSNIEQTNADFVMLQEIQGTHSGKRSRAKDWIEDQLEFLADSAWPHYAYAKNAVYQSGHHGSAILSKFPIKKWENINVSAWKNASRSILHVEVEIPNNPIPLHLMCIHFDFLWIAAKPQVQKLVHQINNHVGIDDALVIAGDFNDWRTRVSEILESKAQLIDAYKALNGHYARTFPSWYPQLPLDRVYFRNLEILSCTVASAPKFKPVSDHLPIIAEFSISEN